MKKKRKQKVDKETKKKEKKRELRRKFKIIDRDYGFSDPGLGKIYREWARPASKLLVRTKLTANQVTLYAALLGIVASALFIFNLYWLGIIAMLLLHTRIMLDFADGMVARANKQCSKIGDWMDRILDRICDLFLYLFICIGLYTATGNVWVWIWGFIALSGTLFNSMFIPITKITYPDVDKSIKGKISKGSILKFFVYNRVNLYWVLTIFVLINQLYIFLILTAIYSYLFYFVSVLYFERKFKRLENAKNKKA